MLLTLSISARIWFDLRLRHNAFRYSQGCANFSTSFLFYCCVPIGRKSSVHTSQCVQLCYTAHAFRGYHGKTFQIILDPSSVKK